MGVIKKSDNLFQLKCCDSEDSLILSNEDTIDIDYIYITLQLDGASSKHLKHTKKSHCTIGPSLLLLKNNCGRKKLNRYNIAKHLLSLSEDDSEEVTIEDFIVNSKSAFSLVLDGGLYLKKWNEFILSDEERQKEVLEKKTIRRKDCCQQPLINRALRSLLRKKNFPLGILNYLEQELIAFFSAKPMKTYISPALNSFERLLLHSISNYYHLNSLSFLSKPDNVKLVRVKNPKKEFCLTYLPLTQYLKLNYNID